MTTSDNYQPLRITTIGDQIRRAREGAVTKFLVPGILVEGGSTLLYAPPGHAKSLTAMELAIAASHGRKWLGVHDLGEPLNVLYLDDDSNNDKEFNSRALKFQAEEGNPHMHCLLHNNVNLTDDRQRHELLQTCADLGIQLLIADSLTRLHRLSESSADDMKIVNACIKEFCIQGISMLVLHHATKTGRTFRGSSEINSAYDGVLRMEKVGEDRFTLRNEKVRSVGEDGVWSGCQIIVTTNDEGRLVLDGSQPLPDEDADRAPAKTDAQIMREKVVELLRDGDKHATALKQELKLSSRDYAAFDSCIQSLIGDEITDSYKMGKATYHTLCWADAVA